MNTAFESITTRQAWHAAEVLEKYEAVMFDPDGKFALADGTGQFAGIVQYGAEAIDNIATVVKGIFPAIGSEDIVAGPVTIAAATPGQFRMAVAADGETPADVVYGTALTTSDADGLFALAMADVAAPVVIA